MVRGLDAQKKIVGSEQYLGQETKDFDRRKAQYHR